MLMYIYREIDFNSKYTPSKNYLGLFCAKLVLVSQASPISFLSCSSIPILSAILGIWDPSGFGIKLPVDHSVSKSYECLVYSTFSYDCFVSSTISSSLENSSDVDSPDESEPTM